MIVATHQPDYIPWLGLYYKMAHCDTFVYLDDVQFAKRGAHNFNDIKTPNGKLRLTIPVSQTRGDSINSVKVLYDLRWQEKHLKTIELAYKKTPYFNDIFPSIQSIISTEYPDLPSINYAINEYICGGFGIHPNIIRSSTLQISSNKEDRILDICEKIGATVYLSGNGARAYQDENHFQKRGIELQYLDYKPIVYPQRWGDFLPCMSVIDYIFNCGFDWEYVEHQVKLQACADI